MDGKRLPLILDRSSWTRRFADELVRLGTEADDNLLRSLAADRYQAVPGMTPETAARTEFEQWGPPQAGRCR